MHVLAVLVNAANNKPWHRFKNPIGMANAVVRELRGTPCRTRYKAHVNRIFTVNKFNLLHCGIAVLRIVKPFIRQIQSKRMVCNIAIAPPNKFADRKAIRIFILQMQDFVSGVFKSHPRTVTPLAVHSRKSIPSQVLRRTPLHSVRRQVQIHINRDLEFQAFQQARNSDIGNAFDILQFPVQHRARPEKVIAQIRVAITAAAFGIVRPFDFRILFGPEVSANACKQALLRKFTIDICIDMMRLRQGPGKVERGRR